MSTQHLSLKIEFGGGLELLFGGQRAHRISLPSLVSVDNSTTGLPAYNPSSTADVLLLNVEGTGLEGGNDGVEVTAAATAKGKAPVGKETKAADVEYLIHYMRDRMLTERPELFMEGGSVRPGILVLINDTDWELEGEGEYALKDGDEVVFISTLHGG